MSLVPSLDQLASVVRANAPLAGSPVEFFLFDSVKSTMTCSRDWVCGNEFGELPEARSIHFPRPGLSGCFIAKEQRAGRGRLGRVWESPRGEGLYFTCLFSLSVLNVEVAERLSALSLAVGVSLSRSFDKFGILNSLKWPNDVLLEREGKRFKVAGILIETFDSSGKGGPWLNLGIGINLGSGVNAEVATATGLESFVGSTDDVARLFGALLVELNEVVFDYAKKGFTPYRDEWMKRSLFSSGPQLILLPDGETRVAEGIDLDGALVVRAKEAPHEVINSGTVEFLNAFTV